MAYEFHYTPTGTGVISGKEVLEQTEDAINDLGNTAISGVQEALDKAEQALTNSENAVDDAQTALNTANNAEGVAIQAQNDVSNLSGTVANIGNRVTTAEGNIGNLQGRMTTAEGNITNLQGRMTTAEGSIGNLQTAVSTAQATANSAQQTATTARQQSYVFRYSSTALVASSTNSNTLLDNTDNLKVGDKVIDSSGVLFSITAIDTANSTFTIGTALIDLAQDSDVVHKSGDETIGGKKTFSENITCFSNSDAKSIICKTPLSTYDSTNTVGDNTKIRFLDKNNNSISYIMQRKLTNGSTDISLNISNTDSNNQPIEATLNFVLDSANDPRLTPGIDNTISVGRPAFRYKSFYGMNYYYGSNNVEFSTKFVTTDTNQTISGNKTFLDVPISFKSSTAELGVTGGYTDITFLDKNNKKLSGLTLGNYASSKLSYVRLSIFDKDVNDNEIQDTLEYSYLSNNANAYLRVNRDSFCTLGSSSYRWKGVYAQNYYYGSNNVEFSTKFVTTDTNQTISGNKTFSSINGVEPSSLSLPSGNVSDVIDISSYITDLSGNVNNYTAPANGWISIAITGTAIAIVSSSWSDSRLRESSGNVRMLYPVLKNQTLGISVTGTTLDYARFIPCQGNV